ncbi:Serine carboxypeptidase-like 48 [Linum perenne]
MAASPSSSSYSLVSLLLLVLVSNSISDTHRYPQLLNNEARNNSPVSRGKAERLIRSLNLFPKHDANVVLLNHAQSDKSGLLVEKQIRFNSIVQRRNSSNSISASNIEHEQLGHYAGYYSLPSTVGARMFYFFFESRRDENKTVNNKDPVVIWLTGGPGCSGELALFYENGPFHITDDGGDDDSFSLQWNDFGWDKASNILFVDQPTGTGFSYTTSQADIRRNETGVSNDLYAFLQEFFRGHPQFAGNDFYVTGESYAGHYIPALASRIYRGNLNSEGIHINLKGIAIGNGLTDPGIQYRAYPEFALSTKLISQSDHDTLSRLVPPCESAIKACASEGGNACINAYSTCEDIFSQLLNLLGSINYYDIRKQCEGSLCYDFSRVEKFLSDKTVKEAIGVEQDIDFVSCSNQVHQAMIGDYMLNYQLGIPQLLEKGIGVLIYAGEFDLICNWLGNWNWVHAMKWSGQKQFEGAATVPFVVGKTSAGELKGYGPLHFLKVHNAGHLVPMDQPEAALQMLQRWMQGRLE